jgi:ABC-2 type transport system ATP-binding protein
MASNTKEKNISTKPKLILKCSNVTKKAGNNLGRLENCSFSVYKGEALVILAPSNNSKTTLAKILCGLVAPTKGEITIRGNKAGRNTNKDISYQPEIPFVRNESTVSDLMNMYNRFFKDFNFKRAFKLLKQFKISPKTKFEDLSVTAIQIVETVLVSSRKTSLYIFDDPLVHSDPKYRSAIIDIMGSCKKNGAVVVLSQVTHGLGKIADKSIFLKNGEVYLSATTADMGNDPNLTAVFKEVFRNA